MYPRLKEFRQKMESFSNSTISMIMNVLNSKKNSATQIADIVVESKSEKELLKTLNSL